MPKLFAGLDVADKTTAVCVMDAAGTIILETTVATDPTEITTALRPYRRRLARVGQETGTKAIWLHKELTRKRLPVISLDARHAKKALSARANKTDKADARGIATLLARGLFTTAYIKSDEALRIRLLLTIRKTLQRKALDLQTTLRMISKTFGARVEGKRRQVVAIARGRGALDPMLKRLCVVTLRASEALLAEVILLDRIIAQMADADPVCRRLMTVPGVGPITALTFRAGVDDPSRFRASRDVAAYFGLVPRRFQSGQLNISGQITRKGDPVVRAALYSAACVLINCSHSQCGLRLWALDLAKKKGFKVAAVACARKLATIMHGIWVTGSTFDPA